MFSFTDGNTADLVEDYNAGDKALMEKHAPLLTKITVLRPMLPGT